MTTLTGIKKFGFYAVLVILSSAFLMAGASKLAGLEMHIESFTRYGLPTAFMYFIGAAEIAGAIGLWISRTSALAAIGLIVIMLGAITMHALYDPISMAAPAIVFTLLLSVIVKIMLYRIDARFNKQNKNTESAAV